MDKRKSTIPQAVQWQTLMCPSLLHMQQPCGAVPSIELLSLLSDRYSSCGFYQSCTSYRSSYFIPTRSASEAKTCSSAGQFLVANVILGLQVKSGCAEMSTHSQRSPALKRKNSSKCIIYQAEFACLRMLYMMS